MAGCVPDLQFDFVGVEGEGLEAEVDSDGCQEDLAVLIVCIAYDDGGLAYT